MTEKWIDNVKTNFYSSGPLKQNFLIQNLQTEFFEMFKLHIIEKVKKKNMLLTFLLYWLPLYCLRCNMAIKGKLWQLVKILGVEFLANLYASKPLS